MDTISPSEIPQAVLARIQLDAESGCWVWKGARSRGYAKFTHRGTTYRVHRWLYQVFLRPEHMPEDLHHLCGRRNCVNPAHLSPIGHTEHAVRTADERWAGHCKRGHELTPENSYVRHHPDGSFRDRQCRQCRAESRRPRTAPAAAA